MIHYLGFDKKSIETNNALIVKDLEKRLKFNRKNFNVESPFYGECVIIDEVHNFVREILNNSGPSKIFYEWIVNAENVKLVFLSGTPVINKPAEIAILFNICYVVTVWIIMLSFLRLFGLQCIF